MTRLAIVDGHEALREGLEALLAGGELTVVGTAGNAAAALDLVEQVRPDVALVDTGLPDGSGVELTRRLLELRPALRVVLYTAETDVELLHSGLDAGARGYALKAGSVRELVEAITRVAAGGTHLDPRLDGMRRPDRAARDSRLSPREREVLSLSAEGRTAEGVAGELGISVETVRTHVRNAIRKLHARNRIHAVALALGRGEIELEEAPER